MSTQASLSCQITVVAAEFVSSIFCFIIIYALTRSKYRIKQQQYAPLLSITFISGISCLSTFAFLLIQPNNWSLQHIDIVSSLIIAFIYLLQSAIPFSTIFESCKLFEVRNNSSKPTIKRVPTTDTDTSDTFDQIQLDETKHTKQSICIYIIYSIITLFLIVLSNYAHHEWLKWVLMLLPYTILEFYFIIFGIQIYYSHMYDVQLNVIPYILIRPIIIGFTLPVIIMDFGINIVIGYMSFSIIIISILAVATIVLPSLFIQNKQHRKRVLTTENAFENEFNSAETHFKQLESYSFTKDQISHMKIIISNYEGNIEEIDQKVDDGKQRYDHLDIKQKSTSKKYLGRSSTSKDLIKQMNTLTNISTSKYSNAGAISITMPSNNRMNTPTTPVLDKKITASNTIANSKTGTKPSCTETTTQDTSGHYVDYDNDHYGVEDTNDMLGSRIEEQIAIEMTNNALEL
eukprot:545070_1